MFVVVEQDDDGNVTQVFGDRDNPWTETAANEFADANREVQDDDDGDLTYAVREVTKPDIP